MSYTLPKHDGWNTVVNYWLMMDEFEPTPYNQSKDSSHIHVTCCEPAEIDGSCSAVVVCPLSCCLCGDCACHNSRLPLKNPRLKFKKYVLQVSHVVNKAGQQHAARFDKIMFSLLARWSHKVNLVVLGAGTAIAKLCARCGDPLPARSLIVFWACCYCCRCRAPRRNYKQYDVHTLLHADNSTT